MVAELEPGTVDPKAVNNAEAFIRALSPNLPLPDVGFDPDGAVALDWVNGKGDNCRTLSISIDSSKKIVYAWNFPNENKFKYNSGCGFANFDGTKIPHFVLELLESMV